MGDDERNNMLRCLFASTFIVVAIAKLSINDSIIPEEDIAINPEVRPNELVDAAESAPAPGQPPYDCALKVNFEVGGSHNQPTKEIPLPDGQQHLQCPKKVSKRNWVNTEQHYGDTFEVSTGVGTEGKTLKVTRTDQKSGWGMPLEIICCDEDPRKIESQMFQVMAKMNTSCNL